MAEVLVERRGHVTVVTINRPEKRNSYDGPMMATLRDVVAEFDRDPDQYVAIITGAGEKAFCAGGDLGMQAAETSGAVSELNDTDMFGIGATYKPVIAAINGLAVGGGVEILLNCDIRIAADTAWFALLEPQHGVVAGVGVHLLPRNISWGDASLMLLGLERVPAAEAHRMGLVQLVVAPDDVLPTALALAERMCTYSQVSLQATKRIIRVHRRHAVDEGLGVSQVLHSLLYLGDDYKEGPQAFVEKRAPRFPNRWPQPT